jgi:hypothetical protein
MALLWIDGFEKYGTATAAINPTDIIDWKYLGHYDERVDVLPGRNSGNCIRLDNTAINLVTPSIKSPGSTDNTLICGFAFKFGALVNGVRLMEFRDPSDDGETIGWGQLTLCVAGTGNGADLAVYRGNTTLNTSTTANLQENQWYYIEMKVYNHTTNGTCNVKLDETEIISFAGNTRHRTAYEYQETYDRVMWRIDNATALLYIDDLYIADGHGSGVTDFLGDCQVATLSPTSTVSGNWTPSTGNTLWSIIDEDTQDANYIKEDTSGNQALFEVTNLTANQALGDIQGVMLCCDSQHSAQGHQGYAKAITQNGSGGSIQDTGNFMPGVTNPLTFTVIMEDDPDGNAWTAATVNSLRIGVEHS